MAGTPPSDDRRRWCRPRIKLRHVESKDPWGIRHRRDGEVGQVGRVLVGKEWRPEKWEISY
jgi:hypothetical protein